MTGPTLPAPTVYRPAPEDVAWAAWRTVDQHRTDGPGQAGCCRRCPPDGGLCPGLVQARAYLAGGRR